MKKHKQWKHEKEFDTKTLFEDLRKLDNDSGENSESSAKKSSSFSKEKSEHADNQASSNMIHKNTKTYISSENSHRGENGQSPATKTKIYEPRPLTPDDDIYEDILEQFASAPTKPKYWFEEFGDYWSCSCGHINRGTNCKNCGLERDLLRSLFILHKPADTPGKLNKKLRKAKEQVDREETLEAEKKRRRQRLEALQGDNPHVVPIEEDSGSNPSDIEQPAASSINIKLYNANEPEDVIKSDSPASDSPDSSQELLNSDTAEETAQRNNAKAAAVTSLLKQDASKENADQNTAADTHSAAETAESAQSKDYSSSEKQNDAADSDFDKAQKSNALIPVASNDIKNNKQSSSLKKPSFRTKMIILIVFLLLLTSAGGAAIYKYLAAPAIQYEDALELQDSGKYEKAIDKFKSLGDYKDCKNHIWECYISIGDRQYKNGEYEKAIETYNTAMKLKESDRIQTKIRKCHIGIGNRYYENGEFENAIASYQTAMEMKDTDALQEKINKCKFGYVKANQSKRTEQVETYMAELMSIKYPGIQEIYDTYYAWHVKIIANTTESDYSSDVTTISRHDTAYFHATLSGGEPSEEIELYYEVTWPNGSKQVYNLDSKWKSGSKITARFQYPIPLFGTEGKLVFTLYDKSTNESMGSDTITFQN